MTAENEGHPNHQVMLAICSRIGFLEEDLEKLKRLQKGKLEDYEITWELPWKKICAPTGILDMDQVKKELHDNKHLLNEVPKVLTNWQDFRNHILVQMSSSKK